MAHNGLANIDAMQVTSVADVSEAEVQIVAVEAKPVSNSLSQ